MLSDFDIFSLVLISRRFIFDLVIYVLLTHVFIIVQTGENIANLLKLRTPPNNIALRYFHANTEKPESFYFKLKTLLIKEFE